MYSKGHCKMKNILIILGTRPEAIKLAPLILELRKNNAYNVLVCNTEQQKELSNQALNFFGIKADFNLDVMRQNQTLAEVQARIITSLSEIYQKNKIDATIVQGDTITVFSGALVSFYNKIPIFHVEAGLRSENLFEPFPEEAIRQMTARITDLHFAPTEQAYNNLIKEGISKKRIYLTGNTVIDALYCLSGDTIHTAYQELNQKGISFNDKMVLITVHRRENHGERLDNILSSIEFISKKFKDHHFILPVHPNPNVHNKVYSKLSTIPNIILTTPLTYPELVCLMKNTKLVLTDSGGIQEEAPSFGNPVLVMRYETERIEGIQSGFAQLVGADTKKIISKVSEILSKSKNETRLDGTKNPYGTGKASSKIGEQINAFFEKN